MAEDLGHIKGHLKGYEFPLIVIMMCCALRAQTDIGLRTIPKAVGIILELLGIASKMPSHQTISDWMARLGIGEYCDAGKRLAGQRYAIIADESISIGGQKLLILEAVPAEHLGRPLAISDAVVVGMHIAPSWKAEDIEKKCREAEKKIGHNAEYTLSDGGHNVSSGSGALDCPHHSDISHAFGAICKWAYGDNEMFNSFTELLGKKRLEMHLTDKAFLLPPNQRSTCRFMNISPWVEYSHDMISILPTLEPELREKYSFILPYKPLIDELKAVVDCLRELETWCKHIGFSKRIAEKCTERTKELLVNSPNSTITMKGIGSKVMEYLWREKSKLTSEDAKINISSDVIESTFGLHKKRKSPDKLTGVSTSSLAIPLYSAFSTTEKVKKYDFKSIMESIRMVDVKEWKMEHFLDNWSLRRREVLSKSA